MESFQQASNQLVTNVQQSVSRMTQMMNNVLRGNRNNQTSAASSASSTPMPGLIGRSMYMNQAEDDSSLEERQSIMKRMDELTKQFQDQVNEQLKKLEEEEKHWNAVVGRQQSPLIDRIPPRGVELWRDFWDTVRKQIRRINEEFLQISRDVTRVVTGRNPTHGSQIITVRPNNLSARGAGEQEVANKSAINANEIKDFYEKMTITVETEQNKIDNLVDDIARHRDNPNYQKDLLIDEQLDDEQTKQELRRNVALRQQIQQEISIFGSLFDIMQTFHQRLRESLQRVVRDVMSPGSSSSNNNMAVTPGPAIKPQVDALLEETIDSQRQINSQAKPVMLPNSRVVNPPPKVLVV